MKTKLLVKTLLFALMLASLPCVAGEKAGNGGDICEDRFKNVRDDIGWWIKNEGSNNLVLPSGLSESQYKDGMLQQIAKAQISCTDDTVIVDGVEKTCKNTNNQGSLQIVCNRKWFNETADEEQYILVHHEYAGLAGFEVNSGSDSKYSISNQITGSLQFEEERKLAIKVYQPSSNVCMGTEDLAKYTAAQLESRVLSKGEPTNLDPSFFTKAEVFQDQNGSFTLELYGKGDGSDCVEAHAIAVCDPATGQYIVRHYWGGSC